MHSWQFFCLYGRHGRVTASYVDELTLRCDSPPALELDEYGRRTITVSVTINDQASTGTAKLILESISQA
jgi:hypothetical protein